MDLCEYLGRGAWKHRFFPILGNPEQVMVNDAEAVAVREVIQPSNQG